MLPTVKGRVTEVPVQTNKPLKEGDVLFRIDPRPYQYVVDQKRAMLAEAEQNVKQLKTSLDQASAATARASAQFELAQQNYDRQAELFEKKIIAQATLETFTPNLETAKQSLAGAERRKSARGSPIRRISTASTPPSPVSVRSWATRNTILTRPCCERPGQDSSPKWHCGRAIT